MLVPGSHRKTVNGREQIFHNIHCNYFRSIQIKTCSQLYLAFLSKRFFCLPRLSSVRLPYLSSRLLPFEHKDCRLDTSRIQSGIPRITSPVSRSVLLRCQKLSAYRFFPSLLVRISLCQTHRCRFVKFQSSRLSKRHC